MERTYVVPLRKEFQKAPRHKRAKKAVTALKQFLMRHMKTDVDKIKISEALNNAIWSRGMKHPPHHVKVVADKDDEGVVQAELFGFAKKEEAKKEDKNEKKEESSVKQAGEEQTAKADEVKGTESAEAGEGEKEKAAETTETTAKTETTATTEEAKKEKAEEKPEDKKSEDASSKVTKVKESENKEIKESSKN